MGYIYLMNIDGTGYYKIGKTKNSIDLRVHQLQTAVPVKLNLVAWFESERYNKIESSMHNFLSHKKYRSEEFDNLLGEWFLLSEYDIMEFVTKCKNIDESLSFLDKVKHEI
jgi:hypothetical protein